MDTGAFIVIGVFEWWSQFSGLKLRLKKVSVTNYWSPTLTWTVDSNVKLNGKSFKISIRFICSANLSHSSLCSLQCEIYQQIVSLSLMTHNQQFIWLHISKCICEIGINQRRHFFFSDQNMDWMNLMRGRAVTHGVAASASSLRWTQAPSRASLPRALHFSLQAFVLLLKPPTQYWGFGNYI